MSLGFFVILSLLAYPFKNDIPNLLDYQLYFFFPATILSGIYLWRYPALIRKQALQVLIKLRNKFPEYLQNSEDTLEISQNCLIHSYAGFSGGYDFSKILRIDDYLTYTFIFTHPNMAIVIPHHKVHGDGLENFLNELKQKFEASR
jgi:hypothetical protein